MEKKKKNQKFKDLNKFIEDFSLFIKQCFLVAWSAENIQKKNPKSARTKNGRIILLSKCSVCESKKSKIINEQKASGLLSSSEKKDTFRKNSFSRSSFVLEVLAI